MLGNFSYANPTKLYFGDNSLKSLNTELPKYGKKLFSFTVEALSGKAGFMMKSLQF